MPKNERKTYFDAAPSYRGGHTTIHGGYVYELCPHHPLANHWGFVAQHRLVAEDLVGRPLIRSPDPKVRECVHHKDENRLNNSPDNLEIMTFSAHRSHHTTKRNVETFLSRLPSASAVKSALESTRTIKEAAALVGVCHHTLRNHFPELVAPYKRRKPTSPLAPSKDQLSTIREMASNPLFGEREISKLVGISGRTVRKICALHGIPWVRKSRKGEKQRRPPKTSSPSL